METINFIVEGKKEEISIINKPHLDFWTVGINRKIYATKGFIKNFSKQEIKILLYHELFHKYHDSKIIILIILGCAFLVPKLFNQQILLGGSIPVIIWSTFNLIESLADIYASRKVGKSVYLQILKKYSKTKDKERLAGVTRQITHLPHPIRHWIIEKLG